MKPLFYKIRMILEFKMMCAQWKWTQFNENEFSNVKERAQLYSYLYTHWSLFYYVNTSIVCFYASKHICSVWTFR